MLSQAKSWSFKRRGRSYWGVFRIHSRPECSFSVTDHEKPHEKPSVVHTFYSLPSATTSFDTHTLPFGWRWSPYLAHQTLHTILQPIFSLASPSWFYIDACLLHKPTLTNSHSFTTPHSFSLPRVSSSAPNPDSFLPSPSPGLAKSFPPTMASPSH